MDCRHALVLGHCHGLHNNAAVLPRTLRSIEAAFALLRKTDGPFRDTPGEIILVDDGSTDGTVELVDNLTHRKSFYRVLRRPNPNSPSCAHNTGVAASQGELLLFLNGDDLLIQRHLLVCLNVLADPRMLFVKADVLLADHLVGLDRGLRP